MKKTFTLILLSSISILSFSQKKISGIVPDKNITIENKTLVFNGAGLREKFFLDLYVGSLYVVTKTNDASKIINTDESMAVTLHIVSGLITSEKMLNSIDEGFENSTNGNVSSISSQISEFKNAFSAQIKEGDKFIIGYIPNIGTIVYKNGEKIKTIPGLAFKKAVFGIWFCNKPASENLKEGMLGLD